MTTIPFRRATLDQPQKDMMILARTSLMSANGSPFLAHYYYAEMFEYPTEDIPTAATDGRRIYYNPTYLMGLKPTERVFVLAHEVYHAIMRHPSRCKYYSGTKLVGATPYDHAQTNIAQDYVINASLMEERIGTYNPDWLFDPNITGDMLWEEVYEKIYKKQDGKGSGKSGGGKTFGGAGKTHKGAAGDPQAQASGGAFDQTLEPMEDPATGQDDLPTDADFKEAIAKAAAAAKAMGKLPGRFQRMVDEILQPQVNWREHVRMLLMGTLGQARESWERPNRRRLVLNPMVFMPGKRGYGAHTVVVAIDTSGSIGQRELDAFFGEVGGILQDVKPKRVVLIDCDAAVHQVREARSLDELAYHRSSGAKGGGGTSFVPVFEHIKEHDLRPETLIYLTDMMGGFPSEAPAYPVVWCATTDTKGPFGETVHIKLEG